MRREIRFVLRTKGVKAVNNLRRKINIAVLIINILILVVFGLSYAAVESLRSDYGCDNAKRQWDGGKYEYAEIAVYYSESSGIGTDDIRTAQSAIDTALSDNSLSLDEDSDGRLWIDSYYSEGDTFTLNGTSGSCTAAVSATSGDFFVFHPLTVLYGSYYSDEDLNFDRIIIDRECSWQLFGALDTVGMTVTVGDKTLYVAAVVASADDDLEKAAYGTTPKAYVPYDCMKMLNGGAVPITAYEVCIPEPVSDFALGVMEDCAPGSESDRIMVDRSGRFDIAELSEKYKTVFEDMMVQNAIKLPWFENTARAAQFKAVLIMGPSVRMLIAVLISAIYGIYLLVKHIGRAVTAIITSEARK